MSHFTSQHLDQSSLFRYESLTGLVYLGYADVGVESSEPRWSIKKVDTTSGLISWAEGVPDFNKIWDDRATYTYS